MLTLLTLLAPPALADAANGPEDCLIEYYDSDHCQVCSDSYYDAPDACREQLDDTLDYACQTGGGSYWDEIWCEPGYTEATGGPDANDSDNQDATGAGDEADDEKGCGGCAAGGAPSGGALAFALLALGLVVGRRRR
jgi:MYXO-CTERM domain-containing protein